MGFDIAVRLPNSPVETLHFAGGANLRQKRMYGLSFADCVTYGPDGDDTEVFGAIKCPEGGGWYRPRVGRCISRATELLAAIRAQSTHALDEERVSKLLSLLQAMRADRRAMMKLSY